MIIAQQWFDLLHVQQRLQNQGQHLLVQQSLSVLTEAGVMPDGMVLAKTHKPRLYYVAVQLLQQERLGAQAVDGLSNSVSNNCSGGIDG